jgi:hypothetical protein
MLMLELVLVLRAPVAAPVLVLVAGVVAVLLLAAPASVASLVVVADDDVLPNVPLHLSPPQDVITAEVMVDLVAVVTVECASLHARGTSLKTSISAK